MKKIFLLVSIFIFFSFNAQTINIPDTNFKNKLLNTPEIAFDVNYQALVIDLNGNGQVEVNEVQNIYLLNIMSSSISDLTGIEYFENLGILNVNSNYLTNLNVSALTQLKSLRCDYNFLSAIDLTTSIQALNIRYNSFNSINLNNLPNLKYFYCSGNQISSLDFSNNPMLTVLQCNNNNLASLNIKNGINQDFSMAGYTDCWKQGNPNLTTICADASEVASVQSFLDGCGSASQVVTVTSACGLANESFAKDSFTISPNPTKDTININYNGNIKMVALYDSQGRILLTKRSDENLTTIDVSGYANGVYFIEISTDNGIKMEKVIKE